MNNLERMGAVLNGRMQNTSKAAVPTTVELGTINSNLSLSTDSLGGQIPRGQYMIDLSLTGATYTELGDGHKHKLPDAVRGVRSGDRVLVVWCGNEPIVTAIVVSS